MSYKTEFQSNNADLQAILNSINAMEGGSEVESTFTPTNSGGTTYNSKFADNNTDLQTILGMVNALPDKVMIPITITGSGRSSQSSVVINDTEYITATSDIKVSPGDVITFWVGGITATYYGSVTINGTSVLTTDDYGNFKYEWSVPSSVKSISISLSCTHVASVYDDYYGRIVVTTT